MRKTLDFELESEAGSRTVHLRELTVREITDMGTAWESSPVLGDLERLLPRLSNLKLDECMDMTPGELEGIWEKFKEVNAAFFRIAEAFGFGEALEAIRAQMQATLIRSLLEDSSTAH
ncbi:MAG: glycogen debranching protein [Bilophila sp.]